MGGLLHSVQRGGDWAGPQPAQDPSRCTRRNNPPINGQCTNHRKLWSNGTLLCGFYVTIKGLKAIKSTLNSPAVNNIFAYLPFRECVL